VLDNEETECCSVIDAGRGKRGLRIRDSEGAARETGARSAGPADEGDRGVAKT